MNPPRFDVSLRVTLGLLLCQMLCLVSSIGCSTHAKRVSLSRSLFYEGQLQACRDRLEKLHKSHRQDRDVTNLDLAVVDLLDGRTEQAESRRGFLVARGGPILAECRSGVGICGTNHAI